mmetsp:Transcript_1152/g.1270  ORF Transcript_1152/g.1270 Transcript_1152/m.1270 type:complete len:332 (-) Transcript_1152:262-1257(-)
MRLASPLSNTTHYREYCASDPSIGLQLRRCASSGSSPPLLLLVLVVLVHLQIFCLIHEILQGCFVKVTHGFILIFLGAIVALRPRLAAVSPAILGLLILSDEHRFGLLLKDPAVLLNGVLNLSHGLLNGSHAQNLVTASARDHEEGMCDEVDLQLAVFFADLEPFEQRFTDGVDALVLGAGDLDLGSKPQRLLHQAALQVHVDVLLDLLRLLGQVRAGLAEVEAVPKVDLSVDVLLERVVGVLVLLVGVQGPGHLVAQLLHLYLVHGRYVPHDAVDGLSLREGLLLPRCVLRLNAPLRQVYVALVLVHAQDHADLRPADAQELGNRSDSSL